MPQLIPKQIPGRGATRNVKNRFESVEAIAADEDGGDWRTTAKATRVHSDSAKTILTKNTSPDISFERSINPYRGCEHGCTYCYARPSHSYLGLSPGLDFETEIFAKRDAAALLAVEFNRPSYVPKTIAMGTVTDPYQPVERTLGITRALLELFVAARHPVGIVTKSAGICRDSDLLADLAAQGLAKVAISITTLDRDLARSMEPRAATPHRRLKAIETLSRKGIPVTVMVAPIIPTLNDSEIERILKAAADAGATEAGYVVLRLPHEVADVFAEWLSASFPDRARRVMSLVRSMNGGRTYDARFGVRQTGSGPFAALIGARFKAALARYGLNQRGRLKLRTDLFSRPDTRQGRLF